MVGLPSGDVFEHPPAGTSSAADQCPVVSGFHRVASREPTWTRTAQADPRGPGHKPEPVTVGRDKPRLRDVQPVAALLSQRGRRAGWQARRASRARSAQNGEAIDQRRRHATPAASAMACSISRVRRARSAAALKVWITWPLASYQVTLASSPWWRATGASATLLLTVGYAVISGGPRRRRPPGRTPISRARRRRARCWRPGRSPD